MSQLHITAKELVGGTDTAGSMRHVAGWRSQPRSAETNRRKLTPDTSSFVMQQETCTHRISSD